MTNKEIINNYRALKTLTEICRSNNISREAIYKGTAKKENYEIVANCIIEEIFDFCKKYFKGIKK